MAQSYLTATSCASKWSFSRGPGSGAEPNITAHLADPVKDSLGAVEDDGMRHALRIVRHEGARGVAQVVVGGIVSVRHGIPGEAAEVTGGVWRHATTRLVHEEVHLRLAVQDGIAVVCVNVCAVLYYHTTCTHERRVNLVGAG